VRLGDGQPWTRLADSEWFAPYLLAPAADDLLGDDPGEVELELPSPRVREAEDDDVDMIPLIDISMVLLIFFMMTSVAAAVSRIAVPETDNAQIVSKEPNTVRFDVDRGPDDRPRFGVAKGIENPAGEDNDLATVAEVMRRFDAKIAGMTGGIWVRVAAHGDLMFDDVQEVLREVDARRNGGVDIRGTTVEVAGRKP
jgi:DNA-binding transcriptional LysR family regulator